MQRQPCAFIFLYGNVSLCFENFSTVQVFMALNMGNKDLKENDPELQGKEWRKSLKELPVFGREQIEEHVKKSGKRTILSSNKESVPIAKTLKRGTGFKEERYLSSHDVYTRVVGQELQIKCRCRASMSTREVDNQEVNLQLSSGTF